MTTNATSGALKAANVASHTILEPQQWNIYARDALAEIIDRETKLPELLAALTYISKARACGDHTRDIQALEACITIANKALRFTIQETSGARHSTAK